MDGNRRIGRANLHRHPVVGDNQRDLLGKVGFEQVGRGYRGGIKVGADDMPKGKATVHGRLRIGVYFQADLRVEGAVSLRGFGGGLPDGLEFIA